MPCRRPSDRRRRRAGTARLGYGALRHAGQRRVELPLVLFLTAGSVLGVQVGVRLAQAVSPASPPSGAALQSVEAETAELRGAIVHSTDGATWTAASVSAD